MTNEHCYPFGTPVTSRPPSATSRRKVFILGAYPSALHVRWSPPGDALKPIAAIPVADEPTPFWDGLDAPQKVAKWIDGLDGRSQTWGSFTVPPNLNGSSGRWVAIKVLAPLGLETNDAWITDCLDTYRMSSSVAKRLQDTYEMGRSTHGWPPYDLGGHPSEGAIVREAVNLHAGRLVAELTACRPEMIVTLGNAAARVMTALVGEGPRSLKLDGYGTSVHLALDGGGVEWFPLAHPAAPKPYQEAHKQWIATTASQRALAHAGSEGDQ